MATRSTRTVGRTLRKIDELRERVLLTRADGKLTLVLKDTSERDILIKALELLRETVHTAHLIQTTSS